jgi:glucokinase
MNTPLILGIDIGGTKCAALVGNTRGEVVARREWPSLANRGPEAMLVDFFRETETLRTAHPAIAAVGVSIGGPLDANNGIIYSPPNLPGWDAIPLCERLQKQLALPVFIEHDAAACAWAEYLWGQPRVPGHLIYLTCGTGFGAGYVLNGQIYRGAQGRSPEIGHARFADDGPFAYDKTGSVEAYCAGSSLARLAAWRFPQRWGQQPPQGPELGKLAASGDKDAREIIALSAHATGQVCANVADMFAPEVIVLGSLARHLGEPWLAQVRARFREEALPAVQKLCSLRPATLGTRLQDCSTLAVALTTDLNLRS